MENTRIIIIGAGCSGISAASKLIENGFENVLILEAENRIGGRLYTKEFASSVVDLGAQWCHGEVDNSVYDLVKDYKILDESSISYPNVSFLRSTGQSADNEKCGRLVMLCSDILDNCNEDLKDSKGSLGSYFVKKYQEALASPEFTDIDAETATELLEYFHKFENSIEASDTWYDTSGSGYLQYWECDGHPLLNWRDKGYGSVLDYIMKKKPDPANDLKVENKIKFNKEVANIDWNDPARNHIVVSCNDGSSYDADHVIVTVSLGVLKETYKKMFNPKLPDLKINAIEGLSIGTVDKIFLEFNEPFWHNDWAGFSLLWTKKDSEEIRKTPNAWLEDIFGFYKVDYQPNILCGWIGGSSARKMEQLDDETVMNGCMYLFEKFLSRTMKFTKPVKMLRSNWYTNKHFRGSYSFRSITTDLLKTSASHLAMPLHDALGKPVLLFAGEATHDHYYSTVHGALSAGYREADRIVSYYTSKINPEILINSLNVPKEDYYDVIVLGAGISGLGAGHVLKSSNLNFIILEGSFKVGGRIYTLNMNSLKNGSKDGPKCEAGAQWLHGKNNELYQYAEKLNFIRPELSEEAEGDYIREDRTKFDEFFVRKVDFKIGQLLEECEELVSHKNDPNYKFPSSIAEYVEKKFADFVKTLETNEEKRQAKQLLDWHRKFQIIDNSCSSFNDISAKDWGNYSFNGESCQTHINVTEGMGKIADKLYEELKSNIRFNQIADFIYWKCEEYPGRSNVIKITCKDGSTYCTNNLICTLPLGILKKKHTEMFNPPLPMKHQEVIENIGFGAINKIFIHFDNKWWDDDWKGLQLLWNEDLNDNSHWTKYISGFDVVYPAPENTLIGWIGGKGAIEMEKLSDKEIADNCMKIIKKFLNRKDIPNPTHFYTSRWHTDEFTGGAYSFTSKSTDHIKDWEKVLSQPIIFESPNYDRNVILMAGEACHEQYFSTVHGAFLSGIDQAKNILKLRTQKMTFLSKL